MRSTFTLATLALALAAAMAPFAASAEDGLGDVAFQKQIFGKALGTAGKAHACFRRVYTASHLKKHPEQNVRTMTLLVTGSVEPESAPTYSLGLGVTFRKDERNFETSGYCGSLHGADDRQPAKGVHCGVDCDGGVLDVSLKNAKSVLVAIPDGVRIWQSGMDEEEPSGDEPKRFGADDKLFRLDRAALTDCLALAGDDADALRRGE